MCGALRSSTYCWVVSGPLHVWLDVIRPLQHRYLVHSRTPIGPLLPHIGPLLPSIGPYWLPLAPIGPLIGHGELVHLHVQAGQCGNPHWRQNSEEVISDEHGIDPSRRHVPRRSFFF